VQTVAGASYVQSIATLSDVALLGAVTWYAPKGLVLESGIRYNTSRPGDITSHRVHAIAMYAPNARRSFSTRVIGGTEGWQIVNVGTTLTRFASQEVALAWRERINASLALNVQLDRYSNPYYTRMGVTLGVARYW
jgi:YaiO family outer membrane protein